MTVPTRARGAKPQGAKCRNGGANARPSSLHATFRNHSVDGMSPVRSVSSQQALAGTAIVTIALAFGLYARASLPPEMASTRMYPRLPGPPTDFPALLFSLGVGSFMWYAMLLAVPPLAWAAHRFDVGEARGTRAVWWAGTAAALLFIATSAGQYVVTYDGAPGVPGFGAYFPIALRQYLLPWIAIVAVVFIREIRRRSRDAQMERETLRAQVAEQRLIALTGQLQPHFLFNTLQGISTLIHRDPAAADEMLAKLSDLLREVLRHRDHVLVSLDDEIRFTRTYLDISQIRFGNRLQFEILVPPALLHASVPLFILQPLVENALAHGIGPRAEGGQVAITASQRGDRLLLDVADDGAGIDPAARGDGIGLRNTRERLLASYATDAAFTVGPAPGGWTVARLDLPFRVSPAGAHRA